MILKIANKVNSNYANPVNQKNASFGAAGTGRVKPLDNDCFVFLQKDFLSLGGDAILKRIKESLNEKSFIGAGKDAKVYKIIDTDYAVRVPYSVFSNIKKPANINLNLTEQDKVNHVVAKFDNGVTIMKYIEGFSLYGDVRVSKQQQTQMDKMLLALPVSVYHNLFKQVCHAKDNGMIFDCDGRNVILNPQMKTLTAIDFYPMNKKNPETVKPLRHIYSAVSTTAKGTEGKLAALILKGALKEFQPGVKPCIKSQEISFTDFLAVVQPDIPQVSYRNLQELKEILTDVKALKFKEFLGGNVKEELSSTLKEANEMINSVLMRSS